MIWIAKTNHKLVFNTNKDLTGGSAIIHVIKPNNVKVEWSAIVDETKVEYTTETTDADVSGRYQLQVEAIVGGVSLRNEVFSTVVRRAI